MTKFNNIDEYIESQSKEVSARLKTIRNLFHELIPNTEESVRYGMPAFSVGGHHLYFGAYKKHIGMYPIYGMPDLENELKTYRGEGTKDSLHFNHEMPLPIELIRKIILEKNRSVT